MNLIATLVPYIIVIIFSVSMTKSSSVITTIQNYIKLVFPSAAFCSGIDNLQTLQTSLSGLKQVTTRYYKRVLNYFQELTLSVLFSWDNLGSKIVFMLIEAIIAAIFLYFVDQGNALPIYTYSLNFIDKQIHRRVPVRPNDPHAYSTVIFQLEVFRWCLIIII